MEILDFFLVCLAAFLAGTINSLAGGGSFFTLPVLLYVGITPVLANTTSAAVLLPGYLGSVLGFKETYRTINLTSLIPLLIITLVFSIGGAYLLIHSTDEFFLKFIPVLVLLATMLFIFNPILQEEKRNIGRNLSKKIGLSLVSTYGGYFNGGLGIALLSVLSLDRQFSLKQISAIKSSLSFLITFISVSIFFFNGFIVWSYVFYMILFSILGGFLGAKITEALPTNYVRNFIIIVGLGLSLSLMYVSYFS